MDWEPTRASKAESKRDAGKARNRTDVECYNCGQHGHIARYCRKERRDPNRKKTNPQREQPQAKAARAKTKTPEGSKSGASEHESQYETASDQDSEKE
jgi:hypothetical protein